MKKLINTMLLIALMLCQHSCIDCEYINEPELPQEEMETPVEQEIVVITGEVSDITSTTATISGLVKNIESVEGKVRIGVMYSTDSILSEGIGHIFQYSTEKVDGEFTNRLDNLTSGTTYYYRSCVVVSDSEYTKYNYYYGEIKSFTTEEGTPVEKEIVAITGDVSEITSSSAVVSGYVENLGTEESGVNVGVLYSTDSTLEINSGTFVSSGNNTNGKYTITLTGLAAETTYYYRSCVVVGGAVYYGNVMSFTTKERAEVGNSVLFTIKGTTFCMLPVEGGSFVMGATSEQSSDAESDEYPLHQVTLSDYYIGQYEVTQGLWETVMSYTGECADGSSIIAYAWGIWLGDSDPSSTYGLGANYPAYYVSYEDIVDIFIPRLNQITGRTFRLPTEAEWEYAARGGNKSNGYKYSGSNTIEDVAWYTSNSSSKTHEVGTKAPNELGIYDMSGNVWEWCSDWYGSYSTSSQVDPTGPSTGSNRVLRGGCWSNNASYCRVPNRGGNTPSDRYYYRGFRLVLVP